MTEGAAALGILLDRADAAFGAGRFVRAAELCTMGLAIDDSHPRLLHRLGTALFAQRRHAEAAEALRRAIELDRDAVQPLRDLGLVLAELGEDSGALAALRAVVDLTAPDLAAYVALARVLARRGAVDEALTLLRRAAALWPDSADAAAQLGRLCHRLDLVEEAVAALRRAVGLDPGSVRLRCDLGVALKRSGNLAAAIAEHRAAVALAPDSAEAHFNLAMALLAAGDYRQGFAEYEWRLRLPGARAGGTGLPRWRGESLEGRSILLTAEQGIGDMIQLARFIPLVAERGGRAVVECHPGLERLLAGMPGVTACHPIGAALPPCATSAPLLSLPHILGVDIHGLPRPPYLSVPDGIVAPPLEGAGRKVGLVWSGHRDRGELASRACPLAALAPLLDVPGCSFFSLQMGGPRSELSGDAASVVTDLSPCLSDFADTAAVIAALDLVISVDTAVAHLAGALAQPVWVLLSAAQSDYRWTGGGAGSPWYPSARLFRQTRPGDWTGVAVTAAQALQT